MICDVIDAGEFNRCDEVVVNEITKPTVVIELERGWQCEYDSPELGLLAPGHYWFVIDSQPYKFKVL